MTHEACPLIDAPRRTLSISMNAYECLPGLVFVRVPNERGRWLLTHRCVAEVDCPLCKAIAGEPCRRKFGGGQLRYHVDTHAVRRDAAVLIRNHNEPKPKLRLGADDLHAATSIADDRIGETSNG